MIHISQITNITDVIEYWRKPTKTEIKFGHGAIHFREFQFKDCFDEYGYLKEKIKSTNDNLIYQRSK